MPNQPKPIEFIAADLAPGDGKALQFDRRGLEIRRISSTDDPLFITTYERLWKEFGLQHEMERVDVIKKRLAWGPVAKVGAYWLRYEMILVQKIGPGKDRELVAVRDQTAVVNTNRPAAVVHLSHALIEEPWRRTGLAGWLRAWPIQTARDCLAAAGLSKDSPITLAAEMEHPDQRFPNRLIRLKAYEKAGFKKVDPTAVRYFQPDFRPPDEIDASGGARPLPFALILRRVGREQESVVSAGEVRDIVESLYTMYAAGFRESDMTVARRTLENYPSPQTEIALAPPTQ